MARIQLEPAALARLWRAHVVGLKDAFLQFVTRQSAGDAAAHETARGEVVRPDRVWTVVLLGAGGAHMPAEEGDVAAAELGGGGKDDVLAVAARGQQQRLPLDVELGDEAASLDRRSEKQADETVAKGS
eukprot:3336968-Pleurochrysis_carterae.AAC.10